MLGRVLKTFIVTVLVAGVVNVALATPSFATPNNNPGNPQGNNGFVKVNGEKWDNIPNNDPHVSCKFKVDFYNYDKNSGKAEVKFELQPPTAGPGYSLQVKSGDLTPWINQDAAGGSNDLDASEEYILGFTGAPHIKGYHVKLSVKADGPAKHKVFWVQPCAQPKKPLVTIDASDCVDRGDHDGKLKVIVKNPNDKDVTYKVTIVHGLFTATQVVKVDGKDDKSVTFYGLGSGEYDVIVKGDDKSDVVKKEIDIDTCKETPSTPGNPSVPTTPGQVLGETLSASTVAMPAELPKTGSNPLSPLLGLIAAAVTYLVVLRGQKWFVKASE